MHLDDMKAAWAAHGALLERGLAIDERLLRETLLRKVRVALLPYVLVRALEVAFGALALLAAMPVLAAHVAEPRYAVAGGAFAALVAGITASSAYLLVQALRLDHGRPVTAIQRDIERMHVVEFRALKWAVLGGVVVWLPALLVLFEAVTGVAALARVDLAYLGANLAVGLAVLAAGLVLARKHVERPHLGPRARRVLDALSDRSLKRAAEHLADLTRFERDEAATPR